MLKELIDEYILKIRTRTCLFFVLAAAVFFIDKLTLGPLATVQLHDMLDTDFPRYKPMGELLFKHGLYFWYPNWPGGAPAFAWHHSPFYILNIAAQLMPLLAVYGLLVILMMSAAGYGMYKFLSGYLNTAGWVSVTGGVYFALNMQLTSLFALYTFSYAFPLYFAWSFSGKSSQRLNNRILKLLGLNLFVALSYPVLTLPYFFLLEALIIMLLPPEGQNTRLQMLIKTSLVWFGYILICLPVIYGLYKYIPFSHRTYVYDPASLVVFLKNLHNGFIGSSLTTMTLIPLAGAIAIVDKSARVRRALFLIAIVVFLSAVFSPAMNVIFKGTLLEKMDLGHITTVFPIVMTMAAFLAIDAVIKDRGLVRRFLIGASVGAAYAVITVLIVKTIETQGIQTLILNIGSGLFISLMTAENKGEMPALKILNNPAAAFITGLAAIAAVLYFSPKTLTAADLISIAPVVAAAVFSFLWISKASVLRDLSVLRVKAILILALAIFFSVRFTRFFGEESVPYISIFPDISVMEKLRAADTHSGPFRTASLDFAYIPMVQNMGFETPDGRGPLFNKYYRDFIAILRAPQLDNFIVRHNFNTNRYNLFISDGFAGFYLYPYAFLNNRYFVITTDKSGSGPNDNFETIYTGTTTADYTGIWKNAANLYARPISVVKCSAAFDRWFLVKKTSVLKSDEDVSSAILKSEGEGLLDTAYYSNSSGANMLADINGELSTGDKITAKHYSPDEIRLDAEVTSPAVLVVSNNYAPNWRAYVDGQATTVLRTNLAFQSIVIKSPGRHSVVFKYEDTAQKYMLLFIPLGMLVFNYFTIIRRRAP